MKINKQFLKEPEKKKATDEENVVDLLRSRKIWTRTPIFEILQRNLLRFFNMQKSF